MGGNKNACLCFARARDKGGGGLLERGNRGNRGGSREDKNGRVNEKREKSRAALRFQTHRYTVH